MRDIAEHSVEIHADLTDIFAYMSNMEHFGEWFPGVIAIRSANSQHHGTIGKTYLETIKIPFRHAQEYALEVKESMKNEKFVTEGEVPPLFPRMTIRFTEISPIVSHVAWKMESRSRKVLFNLLFLPLLRHVMAKRAQQGMVNLKHMFEHESIVHSSQHKLQDACVNIFRDCPIEKTREGKEIAS